MRNVFSDFRIHMCVSRGLFIFDSCVCDVFTFFVVAGCRDGVGGSQKVFHDTYGIGYECI